MKHLNILLLTLLVSSCNREPKTLSYEKSSSIEMSDSTISKMEKVLTESETLEEDIQNVVESKKVLVQENKELKVEIQEKEKTIEKMILQIKEHTEKRPEKRNLIEKLLNITPDSITVIVKDTIN